MRLDMANDYAVKVTLSRRNLRSLLAKLDGAPMGSAATITKREGAGFLIVHAEDDVAHYDRPEGRPGPMHPDTEAALRRSE